MGWPEAERSGSESLRPQFVPPQSLPGERELPQAAEARFFDPETNDELLVSVPDIRSEYRRAVREALAEWQRDLRPHGVDYEVVDTGRSLSLALRAYLRKRERLG